MEEFLRKNPGAGIEDVIDFAYAVSSTFGEAAAAMACEMYDVIAEASGVFLPAAEPAATATLDEIMKAVRGTFGTGNLVNAVERSVKMAGADTTLKNAKRDGAEWAWIPHGDTCAFCITLASRGWQSASSAILKGNHAEHVHANCDCQFAIRFDGKTEYAGYDPDKYLEMYENAEGNSPKEKMNAMRRMQYAEHPEKIRAQKRAAYAERIRLVTARRTDLDDEIVLKSIGAKGENYDIMDLATGEIYHLAEGSRLQDKEVFAGKGTKKIYHKAPFYADRYGGAVSDWQHVKGFGTLSTPDGDRQAEIHWSQCEGIGKQEMFVKEWLD